MHTEMLPSSVDDLSASFRVNRFSIGSKMFEKLDKLRANPFPIHLLLLMHNKIVHDACHISLSVRPQLIGPCSVGVQDHTSVLQPLFSHWLPVRLLDWARAGRAWFRQFRICFKQNQGRWLTPLYEACPLLPLDQSLPRRRSRTAGRCFRQIHFVCLNVLPIAFRGVAELYEPLVFGDISGASCVQPHGHSGNCQRIGRPQQMRLRDRQPDCQRKC